MKDVLEQYSSGHVDLIGKVKWLQFRSDWMTALLKKKRDITRNIVAIFDLNVTIILESFGRVALCMSVLPLTKIAHATACLLYYDNPKAAQ